MSVTGVFPCPSGKRQSFATQGRVSGGAWCCKSLPFKEPILCLNIMNCRLHLV
jgi:hypothetical protein